MKNIVRINGNLTNRVQFDEVETKFGKTVRIRYGVADRDEPGKFYQVSAFGSKALAAKAILDDEANRGALVEIDGELSEPKSETFINRTTGEVMKSNWFVNNATIRVNLQSRKATQATSQAK